MQEPVDTTQFERWLHECGKTGLGKLIVIPSQPYSKANSRRLVRGKTKTGRRYTMSIKSQNALDFVAIANMTKLLYGSAIPYTEDVAVYALIHYGSRRPDLDESLVLDVLQERCYVNDRQVKFKVIGWGLDKEKPRATVLVKPIRPGVEFSRMPEHMAGSVVSGPS